MKRMSFVFTLAAVAASATLPAATVSVSSFKGTVYSPGEATLAFSGVSAAQEVWVAWDDEDKGDDMSAWAKNERLGTIVAGATSASYKLPPDARSGRVARFFLLPAGGTYPVEYVRCDGKQYINTGVFPDPHVAVSMDFKLNSVWPRQQRSFGVNTSVYTFASYINGSSLWAWSAKDGEGNWTSSGNMVSLLRTKITIDMHNDMYTIDVDDVELDYTNKPTTITSVRNGQTKTGNWPIALMAGMANAAGTSANNNAHLNCYGTTISLTNVVVRNFTPYVSAGVAGLMDSVNNTFYPSATANELFAGGRHEGVSGAVASEPFDLAGARTEDVFADAYIWMRGMAIDKNGNGVLDNNEITNSLNTVALPSTVYGATGHRPVISNELVNLPGRGVSRRMQTLYFPQDVAWTNADQTLGVAYPCSVTCGTPLTGFDSHYTWYVRFRPEFSEPLLTTQWMLGFGYGSSKGMMMGLSGDSTKGREVRIYTADGNWNTGLVVTNYTGWIDFAVTVNGQKVSVYKIQEAAKMRDSAGVTNGLMQYAEKTYASTRDLTPNAGTVLRFGVETVSSNPFAMPAPASGNNYYKAFRGSIQQFACWKRTLTEQEVLAAMGWPRADVWRVGIENDATTEFGGTAPAGGIVVDGETWPFPKGGLAAGASATFAFPLTAKWDNLLAQTFRWKATSDSSEGRLAVTVNGKSAGVRTVRAGKWQKWFVPQKLLKTGTNTLTVTRTDGGTGALKLDSAVLGGGWQVGLKDGTWNTFNQEGNALLDYYVADGNMRDVRRVMHHTNTACRLKHRMYVHAVTPAPLAGEYDWMFHFSTGAYNGSAGTILGVDMDGTRILTQPAPGIAQTWSATIPREMMTAGEHVFKLVNEGNASTYISVDSIQLEPIAPSNGTFLMVR